jgi:hypothetical protein
MSVFSFWYDPDSSDSTQSLLFAYPGVTGTVEQSVLQLPTGCMTDGPEYEPQLSQQLPLLHINQIGTGVHSTSYPMDIRGSFPEGKGAVA